MNRTEHIAFCPDRQPIMSSEENPSQMSANGVHCLVCNETRVEAFLDLGETALANRFLTENELSNGAEVRFPLCVGFCAGCGHVQLTERVAPTEMFTQYLYISSASDTLKTHFAELAELLVRRRGLVPIDLVIDIGCNDGSLLSCFRSHGVRTLGVDPARNLADLASGAGIDRFTGFFGSASAETIVGHFGRAALVTATNTFPHIPDLDDFIEGVDRVLTPGGALVVEAHYLVDLLGQHAFDTIYHEHVSYWALGPMARLFERLGFEVTRAERLPLHHGQLRATVQRIGEGVVDTSVSELLEAERSAGIGDRQTYIRFAERVAHLREALRDVLRELKQRGKALAGYGAPAKGSTLLEYVGIGPETLEYIADRSVLKQGRYTPGSHIPIVSPERLLEDAPDYVVLLAWNFSEEILRQQTEYRQRGGRFILPVPEVRVV